MSHKDGPNGEKRIDTEDLEIAMDFSILFDLYRSTFVRRIQDRFRYMLDDLNLATAVQAIDNFDSVLQDHLADVWTTLHLDQDIVSESLGQELERSFLRLSDQQGSNEEAAANDQARERQNGQMPRYRRTFAFDEYLAGRIRDVESQHRQSLHDLNEVYAEVVGVARELLPPAPWSPSATLNALSTVLDGIDVPIHQNVRVILYEKFIKDVLKHLDEACRAFQEALEKHRIESDTRITLAGPNALMAVLRGEGMERKTVADVVAGGVSSTKRTKIDEGEAEVAGEPGEFEGGNSEVPWRRYYVRLLVYLVVTILLAIVAWQLGTWFAQQRDGSMAESGSRDRQQVDSTDQIEKAVMPESVSVGSAQEQPVQPPVVSDARMKRDVLRRIELVDFSWTLTPADHTMLFDFSIRNGSARRVSGIEVVCLQYSQEFELLEPLKAILPGAIEPNMTRTFTQIPVGLGNDQVGRVSCFIPDVSLE
ncbi:hypothetical protein [Methylocaldum szegediense]|uniref:hypothetical protein n=1 Tax=Methylocaldum szegediense TaxID=73780 RepID=UPI000559C049|nr:hypothetical protein [Methylocaldum szegediense]